MVDPVADFIAAMEAAGVRPVEPVAHRLASGALIRFRSEGDGRNRQNGWAILNLNGCGAPSGVFGNYRLHTGTLKWRAGETRDLSKGERMAMRREWRAAEARREALNLAKHQEAAARSAKVWKEAEKADPSHPYLLRKAIPAFGIKQIIQSRHALLVPMFDAQFRLWNLQYIAPDGMKRFMPGARTSGLFWSHAIHARNGKPTPGPVIIGEGFATMAAIHDATGYAVAAAMSAMNLEAVSIAIRGICPGRMIVIAADDDRHLVRNIGLEASEKAAQAIGAKLATPEPLGIKSRCGESGVDFADIPRGEVAARIAEAIEGAEHNGQ